MKYLAIILLLLTIGCSSVQVKYHQPLWGWPGTWIITDGITQINFDPAFCYGVNASIYMHNLADRANSKKDIWRFDWKTMADPEIRKFQLEFQCMIEKREVVRNPTDTCAAAERAARGH